ncbi:hypothetical protein [Sphingomonas aerophila]|uniref:Uncharacterized protein n=1 Tax=Sphingomonas aerophila TaxID=1344948 RepID=A0A7W9BCS5_9SPHN|nr:hypothetical protein [Sphingomonas aerophila]MBB5714751.1 hypothetical protein [Sphingomonas aerophila]
MLDLAEHALGVLSLLFIAGCGTASLFTIAATVVPNWNRMAGAFRGQPQPSAQRPARSARQRITA